MHLVLHGLESPKIDPLNSLAFRAARDRRPRPCRYHHDQPRPSAARKSAASSATFPKTSRLPKQHCSFSSSSCVSSNVSPNQAEPASSCPTARSSATGFARGSRKNCSRTSISTPLSASLTASSRRTRAFRLTCFFFDRSHPTEEVWYYEQPFPEGRKNYTKTQPIQFEEFAGCLSWWHSSTGSLQGREENERAWKVPVSELLARGCNLDRKNPNAATDFEHLPPEQLVDDILKKELRIMEIMAEIKQALASTAQ